MAVRLEGAIKRWIGLSTDGKPFPGVQADGTTLAATDVPAGSSFLETDTGRIYRWDATDWRFYAPEDHQGEYFTAVLSSLNDLKETLVHLLT